MDVEPTEQQPVPARRPYVKPSFEILRTDETEFGYGGGVDFASEIS